jgi:hypothetical protein
LAKSLLQTTTVAAHHGVGVKIHSIESDDVQHQDFVCRKVLLPRQDRCIVQARDGGDQAAHMSIMESAYSINISKGLIMAGSRGHPQNRRHGVQINLRRDLNSSQPPAKH